MDWAAASEILLGSDIANDGMYLEARTCDSYAVVLPSFHSDADGSLTFEQFDEGLPPGFIAWFRAEAVRRLPPVAA